MSRIGKNPIAIPAGVTVEVKDAVVTVKGKLGELSQEFSDVTVKIEDNQVIVERSSDYKLKSETRIVPCINQQYDCWCF